MPCSSRKLLEKSTEDASQIMQARHTVCNRNHEKRPNGLVALCELPRHAHGQIQVVSWEARGTKHRTACTGATRLISRETRLFLQDSTPLLAVHTYHARPRLHRAKGVPHSVQRPLLLVPRM